VSAGETKRETATDPVVRQYREQISDNDLKILEAVNKRIALVRKLWDYKESQGINFVDTAREDWILTYLSRSNRGPLSDDGLREIFAVMLAVVKREMSAE
jgi:chorismate mutase